MKHSLRGFTLIELVMVIVILGVLAAVALPKFVDLKGDAQQASMKGVAGAASSASSINYGGCAVTSNVVTAGKCATVNTCSTVGALLQGGAFPAGYSATIAAGGAELAAAAASNGASNTCTVLLTGYTPSASVTFQIIGAGN